MPRNGAVPSDVSCMKKSIKYLQKSFKIRNQRVQKLYNLISLYERIAKDSRFIIDDLTNTVDRHRRALKKYHYKVQDLRSTLDRKRRALKEYQYRAQDAENALYSFRKEMGQSVQSVNKY